MHVGLTEGVLVGDACDLENENVESRNVERKSESESVKLEIKVVESKKNFEENVESESKKESKSKLFSLKSKSKNVDVDDECEIDEIRNEVITKKNWQQFLIYKENGMLKDTSENYRLIVKFDSWIFPKLKYNELKKQVEFKGKPISDANLFDIKSYIASTYYIESDKNVADAVLNSGNMTSYHPIKDKIEEFYKKHPHSDYSYIDHFFENICSMEYEDEDDENYAREVARMIFYGGIKRLYEPGSKFDYMVIFEGRQGCGKSTIVELLNPINTSFVDLRSIDGSEGIENIQGGFVIEMSELLAFVRAKEVEAMKSFITRTVDKYRRPYARMSESFPRSCIFIGTTNDASFLSDVTGNRRYLPINIDSTDPDNIFDDINKTKEYMLNCWAEAYYLYKLGKIYTTFPKEYQHITDDRINSYTIDDPISTTIIDFVENYDPEKRLYEDKVSNIEIYTQCMSGIRKNYSKADAKYIANIMKRCVGWKRCNEVIRFGDYGPQKYWQKKENKKN